MTITATITDVNYVGTIDEESTTPLGTISTQKLIDSIVVLFTLAGSEGTHEVSFDPPTIANRMVAYGLDSESAAIEAAVRELVFRWAPDLTPADPTDRVQANGGVDERITVAWATGIADKAVGLVAEHQPRIDEARAAFESPPPAETAPVPVLSDPELQTLAEAILVSTTETPEITMQELAVAHGQPEQVVEGILDEFLIVDGVPAHKGPLQGGGWVPQPDAGLVDDQLTASA